MTDDAELRRAAQETVARNVIAARHRARLSQLELAERAGILQPQVSQIEHGQANLTLATLAKLACALGTTAERLLKSGKM